MGMSDEAKAARREYMKKWREQNREHVNRYNKNWRKNNTGKIQEYQDRYWEKKYSEQAN